MEANNNKKECHDLHVRAVWFAAGTAAFMACLERAVVVSFVEQWRVLVFLALNLLLLAILFTSRHSSSSSADSQEYSEAQVNSADAIRAQTRPVMKEQNKKIGEEENAVVVEEANIKSDMSNEELNERAEAFIAMFRQHLASDAKTNNFGYDRSCRLHSPTTIGGDKMLSGI